MSRSGLPETCRTADYSFLPGNAASRHLSINYELIAKMPVWPYPGQLDQIIENNDRKVHVFVHFFVIILSLFGSQTGVLAGNVSGWITDEKGALRPFRPLSF